MRKQVYYNLKPIFYNFFLLEKEEISSIVTSTEFLKNVKTEQEIQETQQKM